jgi:hypothetical protein
MKINYNKFIKHCKKLRVSGSGNTTFIESMPLTTFEGITLHANDSCYIIEASEDYFEQWLECFYNCKGLN